MKSQKPTNEWSKGFEYPCGCRGSDKNGRFLRCNKHSINEFIGMEKERMKAQIQGGKTE